MYKSLITVTVFSVLSMAQMVQATPVLTANYEPGFNPKPVEKVLVLDSSGEMTLSSKDLRSGTLTQQKLGVLSTDEMAKIETLIAGMDPLAKAIDPRAGQPMCTDTPSVSVTVYKANASKTMIYQSAGCHTWEFQNYGIRTLGQLGLSLLEL